MLKLETQVYKFRMPRPSESAQDPSFISPSKRFGDRKIQRHPGGIATSLRTWETYGIEHVLDMHPPDEQGQGVFLPRGKLYDVREIEAGFSLSAINSSSGESPSRFGA